MPDSVSSKYNNNLYKEVFSENFDKYPKYISIPKKIQDLLPNQFNFKYGKLNCVIHYDDVSQREQDEIKLDIQNAYDAYKAKFCINSDTQVTVNTYIFNNAFDYEKYGTLVPGFSKNQSLLNNSLGITNGESILLHKYNAMDKTLAHEFAHVFQFKFSTAEVRQLDYVNIQLMANAIGLEVEEKNYKALCEQKGVDEYKDFGSRVDFKYKGTTCTIYRQNLSGEEELQFIKNVMNVCGLIDWYEDSGSWFSFEYKGTTCNIYRQNLSGEEEELQIIKNVMNVCGLVDKYTEYNQKSQYGQKFQIEYKGTTCNIYRQNLSEEEKLQVIQNLKKNVCGLVDEYADHGLVDEYTDRRDAWTHHKFVDRDGRLFELEYKGVFYLVQHKNLSEEEKFQIIQDIRSFYESLVSQCDRLGEKYKSLVVIEVDESKDIDIIYCYDINNYTLKELDKTLISRSKPEQEVDEVDNESPKPEKGPEVTINEDAGSEKEEQSKAENESPKPEKGPEVTINEDAGSEKEEQSKAENESPKPEKGPEVTINEDVGSEKEEQSKAENESPKPEKGPEVTINEDAGSEKEEQSKAENESPKPEKGPEVTINEDVGSEKEEQSKAENESPKPEKGPEVTINEDAGSEKEEQSKAENESPKPEKGPEVTINEDAGSEKEEQSKAENESPKPEKGPEVTINEDAGSEKEGQSKAEEEKSSQQDTQQPSNFLSNIIFSAIKLITDSISSFFSWLYWSKEEEPNQQNDNVAENFVNNHHLSDDYHPTDEFM